jgi:glucose-6-phosphate 1-dehydrogenase
VLDGWKADTTSPMPTYEAGGWGPAEADQFIRQIGENWRKP